MEPNPYEAPRESELKFDKPRVPRVPSALVIVGGIIGFMAAVSLIHLLFLWASRKAASTRSSAALELVSTCPIPVFA